MIGSDSQASRTTLGRRSWWPALFWAALVSSCGSRSALDCDGRCRAALDSPTQEPDLDGFFGTAPEDGLTVPADRPEPPTPTGRMPEQLPIGTPIDRPMARPPSEPSRACDGGAIRGSYVIVDSTTLAAAEGCEVVQGDLTISGLFGTDLAPLSSLRRVVGTLSISVSGTLDGLANLSEVRSLVLDRLDVPTLQPLAGVGRIASLTIRSGAGFADLHGLERVATSTVEISDTVSLVSLEGLVLSEEVDSISVVNDGNLRDLSALLGVRRAKVIHIEGAPVPNLAGLSNLTGAESLVLKDLPALEDTSGLERLESANVLYMDDLGLSTISALGSELAIGTLVVQSNPRLVDMDAFGSLAALRELSVLDNPELQRLPEFARLLEVEEVKVEDNAKLVSGPLFPVAARAQNVSISDNPSLTQVLGFAAVEEARVVEISRNPSLIELNLGALTTVLRLLIRCNAALPESSLESLRNITGQVRISGNQGSDSPCF